MRRLPIHSMANMPMPCALGFIKSLASVLAMGGFAVADNLGAVGLGLGTCHLFGFGILHAFLVKCTRFKNG